jgi:fibronectin-binding autotransporter adhesin
LINIHKLGFDGMSGSTWTWIGGTINLDSPSDWMLTAGPGNSSDIPEIGDSAINTGTLVGQGLIAASLINSGTVAASNNSAPGSSTGGELEIQGAVSGTGSMTIAPGATLQIDGALGAGQTIVFSPGAPETLILGSPTGTISNPIIGFAEADKIEFSNGVTLDSVSIPNNNTLNVAYNTASGVTGHYELTDVAFSSGIGLIVSTDPITNDPYIASERFLQWTAGSGTFDVATNWSPNIVPGSLDYAAFSAASGGTISGSGAVNILLFSGAGDWALAPGTTLSDSLYVSIGGGGGNAGNLTIGNGSTVVSGGYIDVGTSPGSNAILTINGGGVLRQTGPGNTLNYEMYVGYSPSSGTLAASNGTVVVTGAGSLLDLGLNGLDLANNGGNGSLIVSQGGSVYANASNPALNDSLAIGRKGNGTLTVTDPGSQVTAAGYSYIAHSAGGTLVVENGGTFLASPGAGGVSGLVIGDGSTIGVGGTGIAIVTTEGVLDSQGYVTVGLRGTAGQLSVLNGGTVKVGTELYVGDGGTLAPGTIETGSGTLTIGAGGTVALTGAAQTSSYGVYLGYSNDGTASDENAVATVSGAGAVLDTNGNGIAVGQYGSATLTVSQGGRVVSPGIRVSFQRSLSDARALAVLSSIAVLWWRTARCISAERAPVTWRSITTAA